MEKINVKDVNLNEAFFHFTNKDNLESISIHGLKAQIGEATEMVKDGARVYLSRGAKGALEIKDAFLMKFKYTRICDIPYGYRKYFTTIFDFSSEAFPKVEQIYEAFESKMKDEVYLLVDAKEGEDFLNEENMHWGNNYDTYGIENHNIASQKLRLITTESGDTAFDVVAYIYSKLIEIAKKQGPKIEIVVKEHLSDLDGMFEYIKQRNQKNNIKDNNIMNTER